MVGVPVPWGLRDGGSLRRGVGSGGGRDEDGGQRGGAYRRPSLVGSQTDCGLTTNPSDGNLSTPPLVTLRP